jgi:HlyD family secretion protein
MGPMDTLFWYAEQATPELRPLVARVSIALIVVCGVWLSGCRNDPDAVQLVGSVERTLIELTTAASEVIVAMPVERGQHLQPGTVVVRLDATLAQAEVARAEAAVAGARTRQAVTKHDLARAADLNRRRIESQDEVEHAQLASDQAVAALGEAEAQLAMARKHLADCTIATPVAGVVDQLPYDAGERVPAGAVVAVILQDESPWVRVWIPERALARLATGAAATVRIDGFAELMRGEVVDVAREPEFTPHFALTERERVHLVYEARVLIPEAPAALRPGAAATVAIHLDRAFAEGRR